MSAPRVQGPRDVADLREWLVRQWRPGSMHAESFAMVAGAGAVAIPGTPVRKVYEDQVTWQRQALAAASLWWVTAEMVDLVQASAGDLPAVEVQPDMVPGAPVLCVFERPLQGLDAEHEGVVVSVDAILWDTSVTPTADFRGHARAVSMAFYRRLDFSAGLSPEELQLATTSGAVGLGHAERMDGNSFNLTGEVWVPVGRTDWRYGDDWATNAFEGIDVNRASSQAEDRRWMAVLWTLATQPNVVDLTTQTPTRPVARRAERAKLSHPEVTLVGVRRTVYEGAEPERTYGVDATGKRTYHVRFPVAGHWRNQAYGPGRAYRRPVYIAPFIKGPEGAPLKAGATVHVLKGKS